MSTEQNLQKKIISLLAYYRNCRLFLNVLLFVYIYRKVRPVITKMQHGFMRNKTTITQLILVCERLYQHNDAGDCLDFIYFDFSKAFDRVDHNILLRKLATFGFDDAFIALISSYLQNRCQCVKIGGTLSDCRAVHSGVPQGSVLGPLLFLIFINDISFCIDTDGYIFADDLKISSHCPISLQSDINRLIDWSVSNHLDFNFDKVYHVNYFDSLSRFQFEGKEIKTVSTIRDLGVTFDTNLSWKPHLNSSITKANNVFFSLKRNVPYGTPVYTKLCIYRSCILSLLLYGSQVWYPNTTILRTLECFNKRCLRWVTHNSVLSYTDLLKQFDVMPISYTLVCNDVILLAKLIQGHGDIDVWQYISMNSNEYPRFRKRPLFTIRRHHKLKTRESFFDRSVSAANYINGHVQIDLFGSLPALKRQLRLFFSSRLSTFNLENSCTWRIPCRCRTCRC